MSLAKTAGKPVLVIAVIAVAAAGWYFFQINQGTELPDNIASGNGRIEAVEYDIATKYAGRLEQVFVDEGDMVEKGQLLAEMDPQSLNAQLREAKAGLLEVIASREYAEAMVDVRQSELDYAQKERRRVTSLSKSGHVSQEKLDQVNTNFQTASAAIKAAKVQVVQTDSAIEAAKARIERLQSELAEMKLKAPVAGRILYKLAQTGEVLAGGGKVLSLLDLTDVYMTIFVPTAQAGRIIVGSDARIIFDALPQYVVPAKVSFVAPQTQFTPRSVETRSEREKLMFRVKVKIDSGLLKEYIEAVKSGVPGEAYILLGKQEQWPDKLQVKLP